MAQLTEEILAAVIAHSMISIVSHLTPENASKLKKDELLTEFLHRDQTLAPILQKASAAVARSTQLTDNDQAEKLRLFFVSPDAEAITRQIYGIYLVPRSRHIAETGLRKEFRSSCIASGRS